MARCTVFEEDVIQIQMFIKYTYQFTRVCNINEFILFVKVSRVAEYKIGAVKIALKYYFVLYSNGYINIAGQTEYTIHNNVRE